jgi:hypothetical protein
MRIVVFDCIHSRQLQPVLLRDDVAAEAADLLDYGKKMRLVAEPYCQPAENRGAGAHRRDGPVVGSQAQQL